MRRYFIISVIFFILFFNFILSGQENSENKDVILLIDVSNSMHRVFTDVQNYFIDELVGKKIIVGDNLFIIKFYGKTEAVYNKKIESEADLDNVKNIIKHIRATGPYTDIGNALDVLKSEMSKRTDLNKEKYVLLLSDGYQEAPPGSKYYAKAGEISHDLLKNAQTFDRKGWKIQVLSIGGREQMKKIAEEMGATYTETSENPDEEELTKKTEDFFMTIEFQPKENLGIVNRYLGNIHGDLSSKYNKKVLLDISYIIIDELQSMSENLEGEDIPERISLNDNGFSVLLNEKEEKNIKIPARIEEKLKPGKYSGKLKFYFNSEENFNPTSFPVTFIYPGFILGNLYWAILILLLLLLLLIFLFVKFRYAISDALSKMFRAKGSIKFEFIDQKLRTTKNFIFKKNERKTIGGNRSRISIPRAGFNDDIAAITFDKNGFHLDILKVQFFDAKIDRDKFFNKEIVIKSTLGKRYIIKFNKI